MEGRKQDMPPAGGYAPINYKYVPLKPGIGARTTLALGGLVVALGWYRLFQVREKLNHERIEMRCSEQAIRPLLEAEADRAILKQLRRNRDAEERIMKNVKGWEVGKWKHHQIYTTAGPDEYFKPIPQEYYAHTPNIEYIKSYFITKIY